MVCFIPFNPERNWRTGKATAPRCCYDINAFFYISTITPGGGILASHYSIFANERRWRRQRDVSAAAFADDAAMFNDACVANNLCDRYEAYRPVPNCLAYRPPRQGKSKQSI